MVQSPFRRWYNRLVATASALCSSFCSWIYLIKQQVDNLITFAVNRSSSFLVVEGFVFGAMWAQTPDQFTIPQPCLQTAGMGENRGWSRISLQAKSPFPSGCRLTAPLAQPPTLLPRGPACGLCNILIGRFVWVWAGKGAWPSVLWSHNQLFCTFYILIRGSAGGSNKQEENLQRRKIGERRKKLQMLWSENISVTFLHEALLLRRKPFIFV